jgi:PAS domain S-box-containing protein
LLKDLTLTREYNQRLVERLEQKNIELLLQTTALETAANAVSITDGKGIILWVNRAFVALNGYTQEEIIGKTPSMLKSGLHDRAFYKNLWTTILSGKTWQGEFTNRRKDGTLYEGEQTITPVCSEGGMVTHFIGIMSDVTARKKAEESLNLFRALIDRLSDGIEVVDPETGRFLDINETTCQRLGYSREEMLSMKLQDIEVDPLIRAIMPAILAEIRKVGFKIFEGMQRRKDGSTFPVEINVRHINLNRSYLVAVVRDITERKRVTEQIEEQAALLNEARDAILVCDLEGRIFFWNKAAERIYGWTRGEAWAKQVSVLISTDAAKEKEAYEAVLKDGEWYGELQQAAKDGRKLTVEARWTLVLDKEGKPKSILSINTDITERKKLENQFLRVQRMESIGTLAGGVAHDLNNVLAPILMAVEMLGEMITDDAGRQILGTLETSALHGADLVRQVLSFARGVEGQRIVVNPVHLLNDIHKIIRDTFPKNIDFSFAPSRDLWTVTGDPTQLHQVFTNLCVNARDAMPNGGSLRVTMENTVVDEVYAGMNPDSKLGAYVMVQVLDTGTGIPPGIRDRIFDPFFTTKEIGKGTGLGLSTTMAIVKSHGGFISLYSEMGKETSFKVYLPANTISKAAENVAVKEAEIHRGNGEMVLVVDDETAIREIAQKTLERFGYRVLLASNGAEAVAVYAQHPGKIAVVLTDMAMPVMDGPSTIIALRAIDPEVKIIGSSGLASRGGIAKATDAGANHFILKPYKAEVLMEILAKVLR